VLTRATLEDVYLRLEKPVYNVVYRSVWDREQARELVQETFLRLWAMRDRVRVETVEPLIYRIATNLAANRRRRRRLWQMVSLASLLARSSGEGTVEQELAERQHRDAVRQAIDRLPERLRTVILLHEFSGLSEAEIAEALGIPKGTVASRRHAARRHLRRLLAPILED
jgi:RNA polymerase sigma-70 factor (ECF subfamily)